MRVLYLTSALFFFLFHTCVLGKKLKDYPPCVRECLFKTATFLGLTETELCDPAYRDKVVGLFIICVQANCKFTIDPPTAQGIFREFCDGKLSTSVISSSNTTLPTGFSSSYDIYSSSGGGGGTDPTGSTSLPVPEFTTNAVIRRHEAEDSATQTGTQTDVQATKTADTSTAQRNVAFSQDILTMLMLSMVAMVIWGSVAV